MPLIELNELERISPIFCGKTGNALGKSLMGMLAIDKVNELYDRNVNTKGPEFAGSVLNDIGVDVEVHGDINLSDLPTGPFITISNHPYGSIDGIILLYVFGHVRHDFKVMVNKLLARIDTMKDSFICVTPTGNERTSPTNDSLRGIRDAVSHVRSGHPLGIFPSGAVSDFSFRDMRVRDRQWQEPVIRLIKKLRVPVVPVKFLDRNSAFFYSLGLIDWRVRLMRLPWEVFNKRGTTARIEIGEIITPQMQDEYDDLAAFGNFLRSSIYKNH